MTNLIIAIAILSVLLNIVLIIYFLKIKSAGKKEYETVSGKIIFVDISKKACEPFGFLHGQRVKTLSCNSTAIGVAPAESFQYHGVNQLWFCHDIKDPKIFYWGNASATSSKKYFKEMSFELIS